MRATPKPDRFIRVVVAMAAALLAAILMTVELSQSAFSKEEKSTNTTAGTTTPTLDSNATTQSSLPAAITSSGGPLTMIAITNDLSCQVRTLVDGTSGAFYPPSDRVGDCGTFLSVEGTLYSPSQMSSAGSAAMGTPFTPVSQSSVTGSGTQSDPYKIVTVVDVGTTGLRLTETDSYIEGDKSYNTSVAISNVGTTPRRITSLYRAGDCYLQNSDKGFSSTDSTTGAISCVNGIRDPSTGQTVPGERRITRTGGGSYYVGSNSGMWITIGAQAPFNNACDCSQFINNGAGLMAGPLGVLGPGAVISISDTTTIDTGTPPSVDSVRPKNGATGVRRGTTVSATFSKSIEENTVTSSTFELVNTKTGTPVAGAYTLSTDGKTVTLDPSARLARKTLYKATIKGASTGVKDLDGNPIGQQDFTWTFKTGRR